MFESARIAHDIDKATFDKYYAWVKVLRTICEQIEKRLKSMKRKS